MLRSKKQENKRHKKQALREYKNAKKKIENSDNEKITISYKCFLLRQKIKNKSKKEYNKFVSFIREHVFNIKWHKTYDAFGHIVYDFPELKVNSRGLPRKERVRKYTKREIRKRKKEIPKNDIRNFITTNEEKWKLGTPTTQHVLIRGNYVLGMDYYKYGLDAAKFRLDNPYSKYSYYVVINHDDNGFVVVRANENDVLEEVVASIKITPKQIEIINKMSKPDGSDCGKCISYKSFGEIVPTNDITHFCNKSFRTSIIAADSPEFEVWAIPEYYDLCLSTKQLAKKAGIEIKTRQGDTRVCTVEFKYTPESSYYLDIDIIQNIGKEIAYKF